jgi:hypothetical protein
MSAQPHRDGEDGSLMRMGKDYRGYAEACGTLAELSLDSNGKRRWLALAAEWLDLADARPAS